MTSKPRIRRTRGGSLVLISLLLFGSAVLRLGVQAGPAITRDVSQTPTANDTSSNTRAFAEADRSTLQPILDAFHAREQKIRAKETQIQDRLAALAMAETALDKKLAELVRAEDQLRATLALANGAAEGDIARLTGVYEKMKPKNAAALFEQMDPKFAAGFLARMRPEAAANVLAGLSPEAAYAVSLIFAGRNVDVPKN